MSVIGLLYWLLLVVAGLFVGSFINVVVCRFSLLMQRPDHSTFDVGVLHYVSLVLSLTLRGHSCCCCRASLSCQRLTALLMPVITFVGGLFCPDVVSLIAFVLLSSLLLMLAQIDYQHYLLPDVFTGFLLWAGFGYQLITHAVPVADAVLGAMAGYLSLWLIFHFFKFATGKEMMGYGDFKLLAALGAWLGWQQLPVLVLIACVVAAVVNVLVFLRQHSLKTVLPFGPYLASSGWSLFLFSIISE